MYSSPPASLQHRKYARMCAPWFEALGTALEVLKGLEVDVLENDAIFDLWPEGPSLQAPSIVTWQESQSLRYADQRVTWSLPDHIWP